MESRKPVLIISSEPLGLKEYFEQFKQFSNLIWVFALLELKTTYAQTRLNFIWIFLRPLMVLALFTFIFSKLIKIPGLTYPYPLFAFCGLMIWNNFSFIVTSGGNVIVDKQFLIRKMYFPRVVLLFSKLLFSLTDLSASIILMLILMFISGYMPTIRFLFVPFFIAVSFLTGSSIAIWLNAFNIKYRDLNQFVPMLVGFLIWLTPVFYPLSLLPRSYSFLAYLNPVSAAIQGCRWAILNDSPPSIYYLPSILFFLLLFIAGLLTFIRYEPMLADEL